MDPASASLWGSGINAGSSLLGNIIGWFNNRETNRENERLMNEQNQWNLQMWKLNNEYNSPAAQMARLRAAGINPALAYAQGGVGNTAQSQPEASETPSMRPFTPQPFQLDSAGLANSLAQSEVSRAQADLYRAQAADLLGNTPEAKARIFKLGKEAARLDQDVNESIQRIAESSANVALMDEERRRVVAETAHIVFEEQMDTAKFNQMAEYYISMINNLDSQADLNRANSAKARREVKEMVETFALRKFGIRLSNDLTKAQEKEAERRLDLLSKEITGKDFENGLLQFETIDAQSHAKAMENGAFRYAQEFLSLIGNIFHVSVSRSRQVR